MKKQLHILCFAVFINASLALSQNYSFTQFDSPYSNLTSPTVISSPNWYMDAVYTLQLPFTFNYYGTNFNTIYAKGGFDGFTYDGNGSFGDYEIATFDNSMVDLTGNATISYVLSGVSPNRILKIQTLNATFDNGQANVNDYANVQLWLFEGTNVIEMHYGPSSVGNDAWETGAVSCYGPSVGLMKSQTVFNLLSGNASNPTVSTAVQSLCVTGAPPANKVYRFTPGLAGLKEQSETTLLTVFPNPSKGSFKLKSTVFESTTTNVTIKNTLGQVVYNDQLLFSTSEISINSDLRTGVYILELDNGKTKTTKKLIIQ